MNKVYKCFVIGLPSCLSSQEVILAVGLVLLRAKNKILKLPNGFFYKYYKKGNNLNFSDVCTTKH